MPSKLEARLGGATVYWSLDTTNREKLAEGLKALGLAEFTPEPKTPAACLRHGLSEAFPSDKERKVVIRPLEGDDKVGFAVGWLPPKANDNDDYTQLCTAVVEGSAASGITISGEGMPWNRLQRLQQLAGVPLPASVQWEVVRDAAEQGPRAAFEHLLWLGGKRLRMSAYVKGENLDVGAWLQMFIDGGGGILAADNMYDRKIKGTSDWKKYEIVLDVPESSVSISFGFAMSGKGQVWADDFQSEVVGQDVPTTKPLVKPIAKPSPKEQPEAKKSPRAYPRKKPENLDFEQ
jgi:hypothetical protein